MARLASKVKLGYYPLPVEQGPLLRSRLSFPDAPIAALDPSCGTGAALQALTAGSQASLYGVELDANRAIAAAAAGIDTIQGNAFDVRARVERLSFLYLNPPYDFEVGPNSTQRMERQFLSHTYSWLKPGGVLLMVIPAHTVRYCLDTLVARFKDVHVYHMVGEDCEKYHQCAVFGVRHNNNQLYTDQARCQLGRLLNDLPDLTSTVDRTYSVPRVGMAPEITYVGLPLDEIEDRLLASNAWKGAVPLLLPKPQVNGGRPITPLHGGHVGLMATAGMLNGVFGTDENRHIAYWRPTKHSSVTTETDSDSGMIIQRTRERFSNELALVFADGRTQILKETPAVEGASDIEDPATSIPEEKSKLKTRFSLGRRVMTCGIQELVMNGFNPAPYLERYEAHDWGDVDEDDWKSNDDALKEGDDAERIMAVYDDVPDIPSGKLWIITEADRSVTTLLLPCEY
jgi:SAM-dependent methyltransferase